MHYCFSHLFIKKLHKVLKYASYKTDKKIIDNFTKYCTYYQKHGKSPNYFKITLKKDANFNYSIFIDIIYINDNSILHIINKIIRF